ncbi:MAG TPA: polysaccharide biosynthesis C-terminal domain-containing protein [Bacteroidia bacterium]|nr:polysaccharide biosynthesis C-terminal domain-containing protein [Bacteroidia bacterium]
MFKFISSVFPGLSTAFARKSVIHSLVIRAFGLVLIFCSQVLLARLMGVKGYGEYTVIITALNFIVVFSLFGMDTSVLRFLPSYLQKKEFQFAHGFIRFSYRMISALAVIGSIGIFIFLLTHSKKYHIGFSEAIFWSVLILPFLVFVNQASSVLRALQRIKASLLPAYFLFPVGMGIGWFYYDNAHGKLPVDAAMMINLIVTIIVFAIIYRKVTKSARKQIPIAEPKPERKLWLMVSATVLLTSFLNMLLKQSDILFVSYLLGNTMAGKYAAAAKMAMIVALGLSVIDYVYIPKIAAMWENRRLIGLQQMIKEASRQILIITIPIVLILIIAGKWILGLFGESFSASYVPLVILVCGQLFNALTGMVGGLLMMTGHQKVFLFLYFLSFCLQVSLNFLLIPVYGIAGASIASASAIILLNGLAYLYVKKKLKISAAAF